MIVTVEEFTKNFPPNIKAPELLLRLLEFQNQADDWYSGYFELAALGRQSLNAWFAGDESAASQFIPFGHNADGSLYCFWVFDEHSVNTAPIVFLNSEGQENAVLANDLNEFFALLAEGYEELGFLTGRLEKQETESNSKFREWLRKEFNISPVDNAEKLITDAQTSQPNLQKWIEDRQKSYQKEYSKSAL